MITIYGIPNCDSVKKARVWFTEQGMAHTFHDFKKLGVPVDALAFWMGEVGWETLLNRKGTKWRSLSAETQARVVDAASAQALMVAEPSVIKRPVVVFAPEHTPLSGEVCVGVQVERWSSLAKAI